MRYPKRKLVLFFAVQALAVAAMIVLANPAPTDDPPLGARAPSALLVILPMLLILGELAVVAWALRVQPRVWHGLLALGIIFLVLSWICMAGVASSRWIRVPSVLFLWHLTVGLLVGGVGAVGGVLDLLERWRRPDDFGPEDAKSSGMWPFD